MNELAGWASIIAIPLSIIIALIQTIKLKNLKLREYRDNWQLVRQVRDLMGKSKSANNAEMAKVHENAKSIYRHLIKNGANLEEKFNENTIKQWIRDGKIGDSDWQKEIARSFIRR